jgi:integrase
MPRNEVMYITPDQFHKILSLEENKEYRLVYKTIWHTGQKIETVLRLRYEDIDFNNDQIKIRESHGRYRTIPLQHDLKWYMSDYCKENNIEKGDIFKYSRITIYVHLTKLGHSRNKRKCCSNNAKSYVW